MKPAIVPIFNRVNARSGSCGSEKACQAGARTRFKKWYKKVNYKKGLWNNQVLLWFQKDGTSFWRDLVTANLNAFPRHSDPPPINRAVLLPQARLFDRQTEIARRDKRICEMCSTRAKRVQTSYFCVQCDAQWCPDGSLHVYHTAPAFK